VGGVALTLLLVLGGFALIRGFFGASTIDESNTYTNNQIGISFTLAETWSIEESTNYPSEVLGILSKTYDASVWIDRFPGTRASDYTKNTETMFGVYTHGFDGTVTKITKEEDIEHIGLTWHHAVCTMVCDEGSIMIDFYITDMPNGRGAFMFAILILEDQPLSDRLASHEQALAMFDTLRFTR